MPKRVTLRPLRKANAETRRVLNKALKTEAPSLLCKLYIYIYIYIYNAMNPKKIYQSTYSLDILRIHSS